MLPLARERLVQAPAGSPRAGKQNAASTFPVCEPDLKALRPPPLTSFPSSSPLVGGAKARRQGRRQRSKTTTVLALAADAASQHGLLGGAPVDGVLKAAQREARLAAVRANDERRKGAAAVERQALALVAAVRAAPVAAASCS